MTHQYAIKIQKKDYAPQRISKPMVLPEEVAAPRAFVRGKYSASMRSSPCIIVLINAHEGGPDVFTG
jgi:hypothetical protein